MRRADRLGVAVPAHAEPLKRSGWELAFVRHEARRALHAGRRDEARRLLARCAGLLHQAEPRHPYRWPGEYGAMRLLRSIEEVDVALLNLPARG